MLVNNHIGYICSAEGCCGLSNGLLVEIRPTLTWELKPALTCTE